MTLPIPRSMAVGSRPDGDVWTIQRLLGWSQGHFAARGIDSPRLTAEVLLAHALRATRLSLYLEFDRPLDRAELSAFRELVRGRDAGRPTQHLVGGRDFFGHWFATDGRALVPRPETELLVEACLEAIPGDGAGRAALDLCAGGGCIGLTLLAERPALRLTAVELSPEAAALARENATALGLEARYELIEGDLYAPLPVHDRWSVIASNPPYVPTGEWATLPREVRDHEPRLALDGGADGLDVLRRLIDGARSRLEPGGLLALEIGEDQGPAVRALLEAGGLTDARVTKDLAGQDRIARAIAPS